MTTPEFEWDARKAAENLRNHGVTFDEAVTVFADPLANIFDDPDHSSDERRELIIGHSAEQLCWWSASPSGSDELESSARGKRQRVSAKSMKKTVPKARREADAMRDEYDFDYAKAKPNRFAARMKPPVVAVVLEADVASVFDSSAKVNAQLRSVIARRRSRTRSVGVAKRRRKAG